MWHATRLKIKEFIHIKTLHSCSKIKDNLRSLSTTSAVKSRPTPGLTQDHDIYLSASTDPYFNLTLENWIFHHSSPTTPLLLIYRDSPCVVIGRNQNPWTEVNFPALHSTGIPFIRRRSGGGTVYHDLGNSNFSIHLPRTSFDRHATGRLVLGAVRTLGIDARLNDRNDICVGTEKISLSVSLSNNTSSHLSNSISAVKSGVFRLFSSWPREICLTSALSHVSGSAYKIVNSRAYHHGTMLISTKLGTLGDVLRPQLKHGSIVTKGVGSVRSPVCNLQRFDASVTHESFSSAVVEQFRREYGVTSKPCIVHDSEDIKSIEYIKKGMDELAAWTWMYGQTPEFTQSLVKEFAWGKVVMKIHSRHGLILDCALGLEGANNLDSDLLGFPQGFLEGKKYGFLDEPSAEESANWTQPKREMYSWLRTAINIDVC
ncbi:hypothetical protein CVT25_007465 [Psilocybe cyanescens]|uniref:Putative lipoate-protein ligase A n=1 Tax=Psilocybe cyanescens TaxID=93625 RepID=A0A409XVN2_PSICY|nr:hypothetical protein CVT25_007465 [Psilocybe cyanescens]